MKCNNIFCYHHEDICCNPFFVDDDDIDACEKRIQYENQANQSELENKPIILNLTQHKATQDQLSAGVIDMFPVDQEALKALLTFNDMPTHDIMLKRANQIAKFIKNNFAKFSHAMIGGAPFFMRYLESALRTIDIKPLYAFTKHIVVETVQPRRTHC